MKDERRSQSSVSGDDGDVAPPSQGVNISRAGTGADSECEPNAEAVEGGYAEGPDDAGAAAGGAGMPEGAQGATELPVGFILRRLLLLGTHVQPATLDFARGLNVITGSSDTGKSFAVECLDFMLGRQERPREISQARPYDKAALEIETSVGDVFTFERDFEGGKVRCYPVAYAEITGETRFEELAVKHNPRSEKTLSFRLLAYCGLAGRVLRMNASNETRTVSFRNVANLVLVDEEKVITQRSPAMSGVVTESTTDKSLLALMLTGHDDAGLVAQENVTERRARLIAQSDLLEGLLRPAPVPGASAPPERAELARQRDALQSHAEEITDRMAVQSRAIDAAAAESEVALAEVVTAKSRLLVIGELLSRFSLLRRSYEADLERLEFIAEGHHYFNQLSAVVCPACSRPLDETDGMHQFCDQGTAVANDVQAACAREASKIRMHLSDLTSAAADLDVEKSALQTQVRDGANHYRQLEQRVERDLRPGLVGATEEFKRIMALRNQLMQEEAALDYRHALLEKKREIELKLQEIAAIADAPRGRANVPYQAFADTVGALLRAWRYPDEGHVSFDERSTDITIDGEARRTHGKGVRAIMYSAFVIGLMRFCRAQGLPHPGFVVLDSPLTTYRRRGGALAPDMDPEATAGDGEAPEDMQRAFFEHLAQSALEHGEQIVLFENKEPPSEVIAGIRYEQFSGVPGRGRVGFIPA